VAHTTSTQPSKHPADDGTARDATELARLREALAASEEELLVLREQRSAKMAHLERQVYWLERWGIDLDAWMQRKAVRFVFRALGFVLRLPRRVRERRA
jgi:hypothetical protein